MRDERPRSSRHRQSRRGTRHRRTRHRPDLSRAVDRRAPRRYRTRQFARMKISPAPIFFFRDSADREALKSWRADLKTRNAPLVFTNGVFDILHAGHVSYLFETRNAGDAL